MTCVKTLPAKSIYLSENTWSKFDNINRGLETCVSKTLQSAKVPRRETQSWKRPPLSYSQNSAVREGPRSFREGKREGGNMNVRIAVRKASAKLNAKVISSLSCMFLLRFWSNYKDGTMSMLYAFPSKPASQAAACLACHAFTACPCKQQLWIIEEGWPVTRSKSRWLREGVFDMLGPQPPGDQISFKKRNPFPVKMMSFLRLGNRPVSALVKKLQSAKDPRR